LVRTPGRKLGDIFLLAPYEYSSMVLQMHTRVILMGIALAIVWGYYFHLYGFDFSLHGMQGTLMAIGIGMCAALVYGIYRLK
ncbi:MAG: hypothetical protein ACOCWQ_05495, partial [Nanoarchaeota archaeon]